MQRQIPKSGYHILSIPMAHRSMISSNCQFLKSRTDLQRQVSKHGDHTLPVPMAHRCLVTCHWGAPQNQAGGGNDFPPTPQFSEKPGKPQNWGVGGKSFPPPAWFCGAPQWHVPRHLWASNADLLPIKVNGCQVCKWAIVSSCLAPEK